MTKPINGTGFKLYFPEAEADEESSSFTNNAPSQATPSLDSKPATQLSAAAAETKQTANKPQDDEVSEPSSALLRNPSWQTVATTLSDRTSGDMTITHLMKHHRTSLSIPPVVETGKLVEKPEQEPNFKSHVDSRRRSSQLAEARRRSSVLKG